MAKTLVYHYPFDSSSYCLLC